MSHTYRKHNTRFDDDFYSGRSGKHTKHSNNRKSHGMRILDSHLIPNDYPEPRDDDNLIINTLSEK